MSPWTFIKLLVTVPLVLMAGVAVVNGLREPAWQALWGTPVVTFLIGCLWLPGSRASESAVVTWLGCVAASALFGAYAVAVATSVIAPSQACDGFMPKSRWVCEVEKVLHAWGGPWLAAAPFAAISALIIMTMGIAWQRRRQRRAMALGPSVR